MQRRSKEDPWHELLWESLQILNGKACGSFFSGFAIAKIRFSASHNIA